jgi:multimeric flavodoxin WrbA
VLDDFSSSSRPAWGATKVNGPGRLQRPVHPGVPEPPGCGVGSIDAHVFVSQELGRFGHVLTVLRVKRGMMTKVRKGQWPGNLSRDEFGRRFRAGFFDPAFEPAREAIAQLESIAWDAYINGRKAPVTRKAGPGFADPAYELSVEWSDTRLRLLRAEARQKDPSTKSRVLVICAAARNDGTCPGEVSKTFRLAQTLRETLSEFGLDVDFLDLSLLTSDYAKRIYPCKGCVSTAMPLCHWPCSCYPNHALGQVNDSMAEIYERWTSAHGIVICTPVYWYQSPSTLKLMIDRLVCADGGNPDPTLTGGKDPAKAKDVELAGGTIRST